MRTPLKRPCCYEWEKKKPEREWNRKSDYPPAMNRSMKRRETSSQQKEQVSAARGGGIL